LFEVFNKAGVYNRRLMTKFHPLLLLLLILKSSAILRKVIPVWLRIRMMKMMFLNYVGVDS
jgi:hypothetical protein